MTPRVPPHSVDLEQALLGCCVVEGGQESVSLCIQSHISSDSFYYPAHRIIFTEICELYERRQVIDEVVLVDSLSSRSKLTAAGGEIYLAKICSRIDTYAHINWFIERIRDYELIRRVIAVSEGLIVRAFENQGDVRQFLGEAEEKIFDISKDVLQGVAQPIGDFMEAAAQRCLLTSKSRSAITGVPSGFIDMDRMTTGFQPGEMIVIAARPSMGKTSFALNIAEFAISPTPSRAAVPTLFFSLEMGADQLAMRLLCGRAGVSLSRMRDGNAPVGWESQISRASAEFKKAPLWIDESSTLTILEMRARARRLYSKHQLGLIIVDYLQLISGTDSRAKREQQIAEISRGVKAMAKELKVPVLVLSQLNRESERESRAPRLSDLRESGAIEQDADVVLLLANPLTRDGGKDSDMDDASEDSEGPLQKNRCVTRELIVAKQRNGPTGIVTLTFDRELTKFKNYCEWQEKGCIRLEIENDRMGMQDELAM
jgi:replicative DNA helicase